MTYALIAFALLQLADIWTTNRVLASGGVELNPVIRRFMGRYDRAWPLAKAALASAGAALLWWSGLVALLWALNAVMAVVVLRNWSQIR